MLSIELISEDLHQLRNIKPRGGVAIVAHPTDCCPEPPPQKS
jgi:hypothetical protein